MFMNEADIEAAAAARHVCPNVRKGVRLLRALMRSVNAQSDGWPYWSAPSKAASQLCELLKRAGNLPYGTHGTITAAELRQAIVPIKAMVSRQKKLQARYGNSFDFDVEAALKSPTE